MNPTKDGEPIIPTFQVDINNPLPTSESFISQITAFYMPPLLGFFGAVVGALILWKIVQMFSK
jgi:hypothetical protein